MSLPVESRIAHVVCAGCQVTIIIYLAVVGALLLYMLFLLLVDPLIRKRDLYTQPLHNEEEAEVGNQIEEIALVRLQDENIYAKGSMLNYMDAQANIQNVKVCVCACVRACVRACVSVSHRALAF